MGGRPPGSGQSLSGIPRGLEVLLKKAAVDPAFKTLLLAQRAEAAATIGLTLEPSERLMLQSAPADQLETIIARITVPQEHRRAFLGQAAAAMLAALGIAVLAEGSEPSDKILPAPGGVAPTPPPSPATPPPTSPEKIEEHVKEVIVKRLQVDKDKVKPDALLLDLVKAGVGRRPNPPVAVFGAMVNPPVEPPNPPIPVAGVMIHQPDNIHLLGLKRQLEREYVIKLTGDKFFEKVKTVGDLIKAVQTAVKNRPDTPPKTEPPSPPASRGIRPDLPPVFGAKPESP